MLITLGEQQTKITTDEKERQRHAEKMDGKNKDSK